jgi:hypothetical protein
VKDIPIWLTGPTRSGKTTYLVNYFQAWVAQTQAMQSNPIDPDPGTPLAIDQRQTPGVLALAAIGDNRMDLVDRLTAATQGRHPFNATTPLGFFQDEVMLFYPLLVETLNLKAAFPLRLAPENEQELATWLWRSTLDPAISEQGAVSEARLVRRVLDLMQLAGQAGIQIADIPVILEQGLVGQERELPIAPTVVGELLRQWQNWCLDRGLLTYGIITQLYGQQLLPHPAYRSHLARRYQLVLADDVDEYPAIARSLFSALLDAGATAVFTYNPDGAVRLGLGADPNYLAALAERCQVVELPDRPVASLGNQLDESVVQLVLDPLYLSSLPESIQAIQTISRAQLLRRTADLIIEGVRSRQVEPRDIAVIAPGMDAIARYSLIEILTKQQIPVESLHDQRPLTSSPPIRALLTLLTLVYPGLGRLIDRDAVAEMLVILSQKPTASPEANRAAPSNSTVARSYTTACLIDPVRAGLLADHCFAPHPDRPRLLPTTTFPRWDRLGYQTSQVYEEIVNWIATQQSQLEQRLIPNPVALLDRAIQHFLLGGTVLPFDQLAALRQLIEAAQQYWEVSQRLRRSERYDPSTTLTVSRFIQLLRSGAVTANPFPVKPIGSASNAVTLANVFQYRASHRAHRWQFWMDVGSPRWLNGVDALFGAPLFLQAWSGRPWTAADVLRSNEQRLRRILLDLLGRTSDRVYLCHSDLAASGQEQTGVLLSLVNAAVPCSDAIR